MARDGFAAGQGLAAVAVVPSGNRIRRHESVLFQIARHADLVILSQPDPEEVSILGSGFPAAVVMGIGRPAIVIPYIGLAPTLG